MSITWKQEVHCKHIAPPLYLPFAYVCTTYSDLELSGHRFAFDIVRESQGDAEAGSSLEKKAHQSAGRGDADGVSLNKGKQRGIFP